MEGSRNLAAAFFERGLSNLYGGKNLSRERLEQPEIIGIRCGGEDVGRTDAKNEESGDSSGWARDGLGGLPL